MSLKYNDPSNVISRDYAENRDYVNKRFAKIYYRKKSNTSPQSITKMVKCGVTQRIILTVTNFNKSQV